MTQSGTKEAFERVQAAFRGHQTLQLIYLGLELGLLESLRSQPATPDALAAALSLHPPYVRVWCEVGTAFGVLAVDDAGRYRLAAGMDTVLLDADHPRFVGAFVRGFMTFLADDFARYPDAFKHGHIHAFHQHGEAFSAWVSNVTHPMQRLVAGKILPDQFGSGLQAGIDVLDIGCGAGQFVFKLAALYPNSRFTGVDADPHGIELAQRAAAINGMGDRTRFIHTGGETMPFENAFDLAVMFEVLHELPVEVRPAVMRAAYRALRLGGALFILDETWADDPRQLVEPAYHMSVLVQFSELLWGNVVYTQDQQTRLLTEAGFVDLQRGDLGGTFTLITARK